MTQSPGGCVLYLSSSVSNSDWIIGIRPWNSLGRLFSVVDRMASQLRSKSVGSNMELYR